jgi:hypothetical protein
MWDGIDKGVIKSKAKKLIWVRSRREKGDRHVAMLLKQLELNKQLA